MHSDANDNSVVMIHGFDVCQSAWCTVMGVSRAIFYRYKSDSKDEVRARPHGNTGIKKPPSHTLQATTTLQDILDDAADQSPNKTTMLGTGEKVVSKHLPSSFQWTGVLSQVNEVNARFGLKPISLSGLSRIRSSKSQEYSTKKLGDNFARCGRCNQLKQLKKAAM